MTGSSTWMMRGVCTQTQSGKVVLIYLVWAWFGSQPIKSWSLVQVVGERALRARAQELPD